MESKVKKPVFTFGKDHILLECPYCGMHLIKTSYRKLQKLLDYSESPRGKQCDHCAKIVALQLTSEAKEKLLAKLRTPDLNN